MSINGTQVLTRTIEPFVASISGTQTLTRAIGVSGQTLDLALVGAPTGLVGILTVSIITFDGSVTVYFPSTQNIQEIPAGTGRYVATVPYPDIGRYFVVWTTGTTTVSTELDVVAEHRWPPAFAQERWAANLA